MSEWISLDERYPDKLPCNGRNYDLHVEDIIIGFDKNNHAFKHAMFCNSLPSGMSMPFTHWQPLPRPPTGETE